MNPRVSLHKAVDGPLVVPLDRKSRLGQMVSKCSNPLCSASFLYLHIGKLFRFDTPSEQGRTVGNAPKPFKKIEFFWLCEGCATKFTLVMDAQTVARVVALHAQARAAAAAL
jgi:hypothetical protein